MRRKRCLALLAGIFSLLPLSVTFAGEEHAVLIFLRYPLSGPGSKEAVHRLFELEDQIAAAIEQAGVGEHDGNEVGGGEFTIYCYGPNADKLFAAIEPVLVRSKITKDGRVVIRYGKPGAKQAERRL